MARQKLTPDERAAYEATRNERMRQLASEGGLACKRKYGREYYRQIGREGYDATKERYELTDAQMVVFLKSKTNRMQQGQPGPFHPVQRQKLTAMEREQAVEVMRRMREVVR